MSFCRAQVAGSSPWCFGVVLVSESLWGGGDEMIVGSE